MQTFEEYFGMTRTELHQLVSEKRVDQIEAQRRARKEWTNEKIISVFQDYADFFGVNPRAADLRNEHGLPGFQTLVKHFGSLKNALAEAGLLKI